MNPNPCVNQNVFNGGVAHVTNAVLKGQGHMTVKVERKRCVEPKSLY